MSGQFRKSSELKKILKTNQGVLTLSDKQFYYQSSKMPKKKKTSYDTLDGFRIVVGPFQQGTIDEMR